MCEFEYQKFDECGHRVIKLYQVCVNKYWAAGIKSALLACPEVYYTSAVLSPIEDTYHGQWSWLGMKGWCLSCERQFEIYSSPFPVRSYNDEVFNYLSTIAADWQEPFIHLPGVRKTVPELVGVADQYRHNGGELPKYEGRERHFKEKFEVYQRALPQNRTQWLRPDQCSTLEPCEVQQVLYKDLGFTLDDYKRIISYMREGSNAAEAYSVNFEWRGVPRSVFDAVASGLISKLKERKDIMADTIPITWYAGGGLN